LFKKYIYSVKYVEKELLALLNNIKKSSYFATI